MASFLDTVVSQKFPFRSSLMKYIFDNLDSKHLIKLHRCCKLFFIKHPFIIFDEVIISYIEGNYFINKRLYPLSMKTLDKVANDIWITNKIICNGIHPLFPTLLFKIFKCDIKELSIRDTDLSLADFEKLTKAGNVERLHMEDAPVRDPSMNQIPVEEILVRIPKAYEILIDLCLVTDETMNKLLSFKFKTKLKDFRLYRIDGYLDPELFFQFLQKNAASKSIYRLLFTDFLFSANFKSVIKRQLQSWVPEKEKPTILGYPNDIF